MLWLKSIAVLSALGLALSASQAAAQTPPAPNPAPAAPAAPPPPPTPLALDDALLAAANNLLSKANLPAGGAKITLVIDPLIDAITGAQSVTTRSMERRITELARSTYPRFEVKPFSAAEVAKAPVVLVGTFTPINHAGQAGGAKDVYRVCLTLADLGSKTIVSKGVARAKFDGVDATPTAFFAETPVFAKDPAIDAYVKTCQGTRLGDPIDQVYSDRILAAALVSDAIAAYDAKRYRDALDLYQSALRTPGGDQLRVHNGIYLANWKLGRRVAAGEAFGRLVDYGLGTERLAVKFLFRPGSTLFVGERRLAAPYGLWLNQIAARAFKGEACLELVGHTSPTGPAPLNERLSVLRAEYVKDRLADIKPALARRTIATGAGSRQTLVGTGKDDPSDALDRRVEFKVIADCPTRSRTTGLFAPAI